MKKRIFKYLPFLLLIVIGLLILSATDVFGRPGGGHGFHGSHRYSGGSHHYSGGGSGSGGLFISFTGNFALDLLFNILIWLVILYIKNKIFGGNDDDEKVVSTATADNLYKEQRVLSGKIQKLVNADNNFSVPVFLDYATMIFNRFYLSYNKPEFSQVKPFFINYVPDLGATNEFSEIVVGTVTISDIEIDQHTDKIIVYFNSNYTIKNTQTNAVYRLQTEEDWAFVRKHGSQSPQPKGFGVLRCPHCGSVLDFTDSGVCKNCGSSISADSSQWLVGRVNRKNMQRTSAQDMLTYQREEGTSLPTIYSSTIKEDTQTFKENHPDYGGFVQFKNLIVKPYFTEIYKHWSENTWTKARHLLSERQWNNFNEYHKQLENLGYSNRLDNLVVKDIEVVKYDVDYNYEMVTMRIFAACLDYIVDSNGNKIAGDDRKLRDFSEYWTFVANRKAVFKINDLSKCPSCGAPIDKIGESGVCEYCNSKITDGNFSWILFSITQDEVYVG